MKFIKAIRENFLCWYYRKTRGSSLYGYDLDDLLQDLGWQKEYFVGLGNQYKPSDENKWYKQEDAIWRVLEEHLESEVKRVKNK